MRSSALCFDMHILLEELVQTAIHCEEASQPFENEPLLSMFDRLVLAAQTMPNAWSASFVGAYAFIYTRDFQPKRIDQHFNAMWGFADVFMHNDPRVWVQYDYDDVKMEILRRAKITSLSPLEDASKVAFNIFEQSKEELIPLFQALLTSRTDPSLLEAQRFINELQSHISKGAYITPRLPTTRMSHDTDAIMQGIGVPHHLMIEGWIVELRSYGTQAKELAKIIRRVVRYLEQTSKLENAGAVMTIQDKSKVFVVSGRNEQINRAMYSFLSSLRLHTLEWSHLVAATGKGAPYVSEVLEKGFSIAQAVVILMTPDDLAYLRPEFRGSTEPDYEIQPTPQARPNVLFEAGMAFGLHPDRTEHVNINETIWYDYFRKRCLLIGETAYSASCN